MTEEQMEHAKDVAGEVEQRLLIKYTKGAKEHGTLLWEYSPLELVEMAIDEAIDQCVFLITLKDNLTNYKPTDIAVQLDDLNI